MNPKPKLILLGGGGHCKSCIEIIEAEGKFAIAGILNVPDKEYLKPLDKSLNLPSLSPNLLSHCTCGM